MKFSIGVSVVGVATAVGIVLLVILIEDMFYPNVVKIKINKM